jgi:hypothetical protein
MQLITFEEAQITCTCPAPVQEIEKVTSHIGTVGLVKQQVIS